MTADEFVQLCIMSGCDYVDSVQGVGLKRAAAYFVRLRGAARVVAEMRKVGARIRILWNYIFASAKIKN